MKPGALTEQLSITERSAREQLDWSTSAEATYASVAKFGTDRDVIIGNEDVASGVSALTFSCSVCGMLFSMVKIYKLIRAIHIRAETIQSCYIILNELLRLKLKVNISKTTGSRVHTDIYNPKS